RILRTLICGRKRVKTKSKGFGSDASQSRKGPQSELNGETPKTMTDNRNTILAVILSGLVLIAWQYFYNMPQMERQRAQSQTQAELNKPSPQTAPGSTTPGSTTPQPGSAPSATTPAGQPGAAAPVVSRDAAIAASPRIKIETPRVSGSIALKGARIDD